MERAIVSLFLLMLLMAGVAHSCELRDECLESRCSSGLKPVWLHRDMECICTEEPQ